MLNIASAIPLIDENVSLNAHLWTVTGHSPADEEESSNPSQPTPQSSAVDVRVRSGVLDWEEHVPDWVWQWGSQIDGGEDSTTTGLDVIM